MIEPLRIGKIPVQTTFKCSAGLGDQSCYEAPGDPRVEKASNAVINIRLVSLLPRQWPKVDRGQPSGS